MRGTASFLLELMPVVLGLVFLLVLGVSLPQPRGAPRRRAHLLVLGVVVAWVLLEGQRYVHQLVWRAELARLTPERVERVEVNGHPVETPGQLDDVLRSLREAEWFSADHGGWARSVPLMVRLADGSVQRYQVARYLREPGAVITFERPAMLGTWPDGHAFCPGLPGALSAAGVPLP